MPSALNSVVYSPNGQQSSPAPVFATITNLNSTVAAQVSTVLGVTVLLTNISDKMIDATNSGDMASCRHLARLLQSNISTLAALVTVA